MSDHPRAYFEELFAGGSDPWGFKTRWYETRKRALTLAALPARRYGSGYEPGCANGELSADLAERCDRLLVSDGVAAAVTVARERLARCPHVEVVQGWAPQDWPSESFDLIVFSEFAYYLSAESLQRFAEKAKASLNPGGVLLACHWRHPIEGCPHNGLEAHQQLAATLQLPQLGRWLDADFVLDLWSTDGRSVATREGLA